MAVNKKPGAVTRRHITEVLAVHKKEGISGKGPTPFRQSNTICQSIIG
jgi:hypothetical protein